MVPFKYLISKRALPQNVGHKPTDFTYSSTQNLVSPNPIIPFSVFGLYFDQDYVFFFKEDEFTMTEICRTTLGHQQVWFALESYADGKQVAGFHSDNDSLAKELFAFLPVKTYHNEITVQELNGFLTVEYLRADQSVKKFKLKKINHAPSALTYNGNSMNHSQEISNVSIYLESMKYLSRKDFQTSERAGTKFGLPLRFFITQKVSGVACSPIDFIDGYNVNNISLDYEFIKTNSTLILRLGKLLGADYHYLIKENKYELSAIHPWQIYRSERLPLGRLEFSQALPDLRYLTSEFKTSLGNSINSKLLSLHHLKIKPNNNTLELEVEGLTPFWTQRSLIGTIQEGSATFKMDLT